MPLGALLSGSQVPGKNVAFGKRGVFSLIYHANQVKSSLVVKRDHFLTQRRYVAQSCGL
jgi:hypothetical protein